MKTIPISFHSIALFLLLIVFALLAILPAHFFRNAEVAKTVFDLLHFPGFWLVETIILRLIAFFFGAYHLKVLIYSIVLSVGIAIALEVLQPLFGRTQNINDLALGLLGILLGGILFSKQQQLFSHRVSNSLIVTNIVLFVMVCFFKWYLLTLKISLPPQLGNFENPFEHLLWRNVNHIQEPAPARITSNKSQGKFALQGYLLDYGWTGLSFVNQTGFDISSYKLFKLQFYSPQHTELELRLDDKHGIKAYARPLPIEQGTNSVSFDLTTDHFTLVDKTQITNVSIYYQSANGPSYYEVDKLHFE